MASLARGLAGRGHRSRVIALFGPAPDERCDAFSDLRAWGVEVVEVRLPARSYRAEIRKLTGLFRERPDTIVHSHGYHADLVAWRGARAAGVPVVSTVHGFTGGTLWNRAYEWLDRRALARFDAVVAVSRPLAMQLQKAGIGAARLHLIPNAWAPSQSPLPRDEARRALGLSADRPLVGWIGRLSWEKGPDLFLQALARLPQHVRGVVVGDGDLSEQLRGLAASLGLEGRVSWLGAIPQAGRLLTAFDVVVLSSRTEGTPIVLLEALSSGVPVVAAAVGGIPDVVPGEEALLVPPDDPVQLAEATARALSQVKEAEARAVRGRERMTTAYAVEPWLRCYEAAYRGLRCR